MLDGTGEKDQIEAELRHDAKQGGNKWVHGAFRVGKGVIRHAG